MALGADALHTEARVWSEVMWRVKGCEAAPPSTQTVTHTRRERETNKSTHAVCESVRGSLPEAVPPKSEKACQRRQAHQREMEHQAEMEHQQRRRRAE